MKLELLKKKFKGKKIIASQFNNETLKEFKIFENLVLDNFDENKD